MSVFSPRRLPLLGALVMTAAVVVTYFPSLGIGFWTDDYLLLDMAGRFSGADYLAKIFDPRVQIFWYRPMVGLQWKIAYLLFQGEPSAYHLVQVALHLANCLLIYWLVTRVTLKWRVGLCAGLVYGTLPLFSMAVFRPAVQDPLASLLYLLTLLLWMEYLESDDRLKLVLAYLTFVGALLSKEVGVTLPILLFLADRLLVKKPVSFSALFKRYALFIVILILYALLEVIVSTRSVFTQQIGYGVGEQNLSVFLQFLSWLAFPWDSDQSFRYAWLCGAILLFAYACFRHDRRLLFLGAAGVLPTIVAAPIPPHLFNPRYLYLPSMASAVGYSLLLQVALRAIQNSRWLWTRRMLGLIVALAVLSGGIRIAELTENHGGFVRQIRLQFRPIYQRHAAFEPDTLLYFLDTPLQTLDISGLMFIRYGANVLVSGVDRGAVGDLRNHGAAYVFYLDDQNLFREQAVDKNTTPQISPGLPAQFQDSISLDALEITSASVKRGDALVAILFWRATASVGKDYTVFTHLVDADGQIITGVDSPPRRGSAPTSSWRVNTLQPDGIVIPLDSSVPLGDYNLEIGLYDRATMNRLLLVDVVGNPYGDKVVVGPIRVSE